MTIYQYSNRKKGQALIFVFFVLLIVSILVGALATMLKNEIRTRSMEKDGLLALYSAEAGIEVAKTQEFILTPINDTTGNLTLRDKYKYNYNYNSITGNWTIVAIGERRDALDNNKIIAEKRLRVIYEPALNTTSGRYYFKARQPWSWREN